MFDSGFFPSTSGTVAPSGAFVGNKAKPASFLASVFYRFVGNGVSAVPTTGFAISIKSGLTITVHPGWGLVNGYPFELTEALDIVLVPTASPTQHFVGVKILRDGSDVPIGFTNDNVYAMSAFDPADAVCFGYVDLVANATSIASNDVHDTRYLPSYCGVVEAQRVQLEALAAEYQAMIDYVAEHGVPGHGGTHEAGAADALSGYLAFTAQTKTDNEKSIARANANAAGLSGGVHLPLEGATPIDDYTDSVVIALANVGRNARVTAATAKTVTLPELTAGYYGFITRAGAGALSLVAGSGVTIHAPGNRLKLAEQYTKIYYEYISATVVEITGATVA